MGSARVIVFTLNKIASKHLKVNIWVHMGSARVIVLTLNKRASKHLKVNTWGHTLGIGYS